MFAIGDEEWPGLSKLAEECGEVVQVIGKLMGTGGKVDHWDGTNLQKRLIDEMADVLGALKFVSAQFTHEEYLRYWNRSIDKADLFNEWHHAR